VSNVRLSRDQVAHVAMLARLELTEEETRKYMEELNQILEHLERLNELDTSDIPPTSHAIAMTNVLRDDSVTPPLDRNDALMNAPDPADGCFRVPRVIAD
jgi:aspartyl-tRNA(Asn)/glutamyl-tRNA(Gln) amidotransferase subunit C